MATPFSTAARETVSAVKQLCTDAPHIRAVVGLDGFVDEIVAVVRRRRGPDHFEPFSHIAEFAQAVGAAAGLSTNFELVTEQIKLGGNAPIMSSALAQAGVCVTCIGALGEPELHPAFDQLAARARVISLADPGYTQAVEFTDGKLLLGKLTTMNAVTWERLMAAVGLENLVRLCLDAHILVFANWTMLPHMDDIWLQFKARVLPRFGAHRPIVFFDLADPQKRTTAELRRALRIIEGFTPQCQTYLGLNRKEAAEVGAALGCEHTTRVEADLRDAVLTLASELNLTGIVVHPTDRAAAWREGEYSEVMGPFTATPKLTTGAGDNFNAGFCHGLALDMSLQAALTLGNATSGFYVREAYSPTRAQLVRFMEAYTD